MSATTSSSSYTPSHTPLRVTYQGRTYDITKFVARHPGGAKVFHSLSNAPIDDLLAGLASANNELKHEHSKAAYTILAKYEVKTADGNSLIDADGIDFGKPIFWQVGNLGGRYWAWIHEPVDIPMRLFESDFIEYFSRTQWYTIPAVWLPVVAVLMVLNFMSLANMTDSLFTRSMYATALFCLGGLAWTLMEYVLHRYLFHWHPNSKSYRQLTAHFLLHGIHHKTPMDPGRLVFPPALAVVGVLFFFTIYSTLLPFHVFSGLGAGQLFGYVVYDCIHYYLHHGEPSKTNILGRHKAYHHAHHFKEPDLGFGISSTLWDEVFATVGTIGKKRD